MPVLKSLLIDSKDGEWGKEEPLSDSMQMSVIRGTDFEEARVGRIANVPRRFILNKHAHRKRLRASDIILETAGGSKNKPTGRTLLVTASLLANAPLPVTCASFARFLRVDPQKAFPPFMFWLLQHLYENGILFKYHTQHTGVARFQYTTFAENEELELPDYPTQRRIASVLSAYDDLIENNTRRIAILEEMARRLYEEWFVQFRFPGHEEAEFDGELPKGWQAKELGDLATDKRDSVHPSQVPGETPYVGLEHIPRRSITLNDWSTADSVGSNKLLFKRGDILFGKIRPYFHKVVIAPLGGVCSTDTIVMRPKSLRLSALVLCCASSDAFVKHATQTSNGTKMPRADWKVLRHFPVAVPAETTLAQFNSCLEPIVGQTRALMFKNANLRAQRDLLLPKLISGEIDVSNLPLPGTEDQAA